MVTCREDIVKYNSFLRLTDEEVDAIAKVADYISQSPALTQMAQDIYKQLFLQRKFFGEVAGLAKNVENNAYNGLFWVVIYISALDLLIERYKKLGISLEVMSDSIFDLALWLRNFKAKYGYWGIESYPWLWHSFSGRLFRLGRLEFERNEFGGEVTVFRSKTTDELVTLCLSGIEFRRDGLANGVNEIFEKHPKVTYYNNDGETAVGNRVREDGVIESGFTYLDLSEYECVFKKGDRVLEVHIPQGKKMIEEECKSSYEQAIFFFKKHFQYECKAFTCFSWLLDPTVGKLAGDGSNIACFGSQYAKIPIPCSAEGWKKFVLTKKPEEGAKASSGFQRRIEEHIENGGRIREVYGFILLDNSTKLKS